MRILVVLLSTVLALAGGEPLVLNADLAGRLAATYAPGLAAAEVALTAARAESRAGLAFIRPQIETTAWWRYQDRPQRLDAGKLGTWALDERDDYGARVSLRQILYSHRCGPARAGAQALTALAVARRDLARRAAVTAARCAVADVQLAQVRLGLARRRLDECQAEHEIAVTAHRLQTVRADVPRQTGLHLLQARDRVIEAEALVAMDLRRLATLVGLEARPIAVQEPLRAPDDAETLLMMADRALEDDPDLRLARSQEDLAASEAAAASASRLPELALEADWGSSGAEPGRQEEELTVGLVLTWRLYDGGLAQARREAAQARSAQAQTQAVATRTTRHETLDRQRIAIAQLQRRLTLADEALTLAEQNLERVRSAFQAGQTDLGPLTEAARLRDQAALHQAVLCHDLRYVVEEMRTPPP